MEVQVADQQQNYANHTRIDPLFHQVTFPIAAISILLALWITIRQFGLASVELLILSILIMILALRARSYATKLQDRIIRIEERLRLQSLLTEPLRSRIPELTEGQLIALRFASDGEIPALVERVLASKMPKDDIKKAIVNWRADYFRV
jgi:uncharacterized protein DUF6526